MMNIKQAQEIIVSVIPSVQTEILRPENVGNPLTIIRILTAYIEKMIAQACEDELGKALHLMEYMHEKGEWRLQNAVENIFVFSLDSILNACPESRRGQVTGKIPIGIYTAYVNQIYRSGS
ncbi:MULTISPECIES: DUF7674 family protein [Sphingobacterium]|nr:MULTISPECIES: hypothetical protein [Sphingobacterium]QIH33301.1 hypothetical protein G6053_10590 [Sphingobacterium sp. DR205]